jgi:hypothetical protein
MSAKKASERYILRQEPLEGIGRAYAFFADIVRGVFQAFRRYFCRISNPHTFLKFQWGFYDHRNGSGTVDETAQ